MPGKGTRIRAAWRCGFPSKLSASGSEDSGSSGEWRIPSGPGRAEKRTATRLPAPSPPSQGQTVVGSRLGARGALPPHRPRAAGSGQGTGGARDTRCGLPPPGSHWSRGGTCLRSGPISGQYCPVGGWGVAWCCPRRHGPGLFPHRPLARAVPRDPAVPLLPAGARRLPSAEHSGQLRASSVGCLRRGGGVRGQPCLRLPAAPRGHVSGSRRVPLRWERPPDVAGARKATFLLSHPGGGPAGAPRLRVDADEAEHARQK